MSTPTTPDGPDDPTTDPDSDPGMLNPRTGAAASQQDAGDGDGDGDPDANPDNLNPRD